MHIARQRLSLESSPDGPPGWFLRFIGRNPGLFLAVVAPLVAAYGLTAHLSVPYQGDALTNVVTAWYLGTTGSPIATAHGHMASEDQYGNFSWFVESERGTVGKYPPGAPLLAAPVYAFVDAPLETVMLAGSNRPDLEEVPFPLPPIWPAGLVAVVATASAMGVLGLTFATFGSRLQAWTGAMIAGLGSGAWSVASDMFWQHGPGMLWIALGVHLARVQRYWWAGAAFGAAILTRPHLALIAASVGVACSIGKRSPGPVMRVGAPASLGLILYLVYGWWLYGRVDLFGGYGSDFGKAEPGIVWYLQNLVGALFDLERGLVTWTPYLAILAGAVIFARKALGPAAAGGLLGAVGYLLVQYKLNRFTGGGGFFAYRYPLEALVGMAPGLFVAYLRVVRNRRGLRVLFWATAIVAIDMHAVGAVLWPGVLI